MNCPRCGSVMQNNACICGNAYHNPLEVADETPPAPEAADHDSLPPLIEEAEPFKPIRPEREG